MTYESKYVELGFYVNGAYRQFSGHRYVTEDAAEIAVLDALSDAKRIDEPQPEEDVKAPVKRKAPAKSSE